MYYVQKTLEISSAHMLMLDHNSKCENLHGHNWIITVFCQSETLDENGMVVDFSRIKEIVKGKLDHKFLNDVVDFNPTAENMARWICEQVPHCYKVQVQESEGNTVEYEV
jgi:6-pyruvoyltetrahydropterin/6-carboxytetrahydropterin synthase